MERLDITREEGAILSVSHAWASSLVGEGRLLRTDRRPGDGFVLVLGGSCAYRFDAGGSFTAAAGDLLYLADGDAYVMRLGAGEYSYICVNFRFADARRRKSLCVHLPEVGETEAVMRRLLRLFPSGGRDAFFDRMALVYSVYRSLCSASRSDYVAVGARDAIAAVKAYMEGHFADPMLDGAGLAALAGMSEVYFRTLFKRIFQISPLQYILSLRLAHAVELMRYPDLSLSDIAAQSGFSSLTYFCRVFRSKRGIPPARYRREECKK